MEKMTNSYLIDTHIFIWWMENNKRLSKKLYDLLSNPQNQIFLSVVSIWEIVIKQSKNRLNISVDIEKGVKISGFSTLPIEVTHALKIQELPIYHNDPFDRMIIAQAQIENLTLITNDPKIKKYKVKIFK